MICLTNAPRSSEQTNSLSFCSNLKQPYSGTIKGCRPVLLLLVLGMLVVLVVLEELVVFVGGILEIVGRKNLNIA